MTTERYQERLLKVILAPVISEKSTRTAEIDRQFAFRVAKDATKPEIKKAVETLFKVEVEKVNVCRVKGKVKRFRGRPGYRPGWKKAYVSLKPGYDIKFGE